MHALRSTTSIFTKIHLAVQQLRSDRQLGKAAHTARENVGATRGIICALHKPQARPPRATPRRVWGRAVGCSRSARAVGGQHAAREGEDGVVRGRRHETDEMTRPPLPNQRQITCLPPPARFGSYRATARVVLRPPSHETQEWTRG